MEHIYSSNSLLYLTGKLAENIKKSESELFKKTMIITPTRGMDSWLKTELSMKNGVFANFEFLNQDGLFARIYETVLGERLQNNADIIKYRVYDCLGTSRFKNEFKDVADYYEDDNLRRIQLAAKIADLFDQYQIYRPEMIRDWTEDKFTFENTQKNEQAHKAEQWQQWIWKEIKIESKASYRNRMLAEMKQKPELLSKDYPEIHFFGITIYTKFHRDFIKNLSAYTSIHFYLNLPTKEKTHKNELLLNFGLKSLELAKAFETEGFHAEENNKATLLGRMQNQILHNGSDLEPVEDDSIQINSCYTPAREAECLYNYLTDLFARHKHLNPGDVLVVASDIDKYAPYIKAVFKSAPLTIPFRISGAANTSEDTIVAALEQILSFKEEDLTSEKVISLLEHKRIKQCFRVKDTDYLRSVIKKANIRFGRKNSTEDDSCYVSWEYGLEKILLGYAILTNDEDESDREMSIFPYRDSEASQSFDLLKLKSFYDDLTSILDDLKDDRTFKDWKKYLLKELIENMIFLDNFKKDDRTEMSSIHRALSFTDQLEDDEKIPFKVFMEALNSKLFRDSWKTELNTGNVTVSSPIPARGLPHKVVCFLGLDNDLFPRKQIFMGFDLLGKNELDGDRNIKESDKYLFLDTLLSAKEFLYLSYTGQSVKNNDVIPPSIVVDILYDYLDTETILTEHPLHGFSSVYQADNDRLFTYLYKSGQEAEEENSEAPVESDEENKIEEISIRDLVKFFQAPLEYYYNNILGIVYEDKENILSETEIFELDSLQRWKLKQELVKREVNEIEPWRIKGVKEGYLPLKSGSGAAAEDVNNEIRLLKPSFQKIVAKRPEKHIVIDTTIDNYRITGTIDSVFDKDFLAYSVSKYPLKYKIEALIKSLLLIDSEDIQIDSTRFLNLYGNISDIPIDRNSADSILRKLLKYYSEGNSSPLLFTINAFDKLTKLEEEFVRKAKKGEEPKTVQPDHLLEILQEEAYPGEERDIRPNLYLRILFREEKFNEFGEDDLKKFKEIGNTLKLNDF